MRKCKILRRLTPSCGEPTPHQSNTPSTRSHAVWGTPRWCSPLPLPTKTRSAPCRRVKRLRHHCSVCRCGMVLLTASDDDVHWSESLDRRGILKGRHALHTDLGRLFDEGGVKNERVLPKQPGDRFYDGSRFLLRYLAARVRRGEEGRFKALREVLLGQHALNCGRRV